MDALQERILRRNAWRLLPLLTVAYVINYLDRTNISFAALTMNKDLGLTATQYGRGAGMFFLAAVQLFFIGIIGEYVGAVYTQVQKRPLVVERERLNFSPAGEK